MGLLTLTGYGMLCSQTAWDSPKSVVLPWWLQDPKFITCFPLVSVALTHFYLNMFIIQKGEPTLASAITTGHLGQLLEPPTWLFTPWQNQFPRQAPTNWITKGRNLYFDTWQNCCSWLTLASSIKHDWGFACQDMWFYCTPLEVMPKATIGQLHQFPGGHPSNS